MSLARAVYQDREICLLDDPISAVDSHVARHLFDKVIGETGILAGKTRILVTHSLAYLKKVDKIVVMNGELEYTQDSQNSDSVTRIDINYALSIIRSDGRITEAGSYDQLIKDNGAFGEILKEYLNELVERQKSEHSIIEHGTVPKSSTSLS